MNNYLDNYQKVQVTTVDRIKLVIMLYDGAISFLKTAIANLEKNDFAGKGVYIAKAQDIIDELNNSLNMKEGGEIAVNLRKIYNFLYFYLVKANLSRDKRKIEEVINILSTLRDAWEHVSEKEKSKNSEDAIPMNSTNENVGEIRV